MPSARRRTGRRAKGRMMTTAEMAPINERLNRIDRTLFEIRSYQWFIAADVFERFARIFGDEDGEWHSGSVMDRILDYVRTDIEDEEEAQKREQPHEQRGAEQATRGALAEGQRSAGRARSPHG